MSAISKILNIDGDYLERLDQALSLKSGKTTVIDEIGSELEVPTPDVDLLEIDRKLFSLNLIEGALRVYTPPKGFFVKKEKAIELLAANAPQNLLDHFGYGSVTELIEKETFESVMSALRFTQTTEWMHNFFDVAYGTLSANDFEEREVVIKTLEPKWSEIAEKFLKKKLHNVSHLKEHGVIFITPDFNTVPGETLRTLLLLLHYLHEVPFYSKLLRKFSGESDFISKLQSLLRGDVLNIGDSELGANNHNRWMIVQRYLAKDDSQDPRLFMHHVNPEAEHWYLVGQDLQKVETELNIPGISRWKDTDWTGYNLVDMVMTLVKPGEDKYIYHQREAMWNRIFCGHFGRAKMNNLIEENIIKGYIEL